MKRQDKKWLLAYAAWAIALTLTLTGCTDAEAEAWWDHWADWIEDKLGELLMRLGLI